ncbi:MAG: trypsin-like peptidase domain-containing protein, partial [Acidobacteria bacterium]|nr:trypsin-like peptidase domain-containing protein [Acidobacteriota bacterium]
MATGLLALLFLGAVSQGTARAAEVPRQRLAAPLSRVESLSLPALDLAVLADEDAAREAAGEPYRFAQTAPLAVRTPATAGSWETLADGSRLWRLRIASPGARSLNFGFTRFHLPEGARLLIYAPDESVAIRPYTAADNRPHGELWTPVLPSPEAVLELSVPAEREGEVELELPFVQQGYRGFAHLVAPAATGPFENVAGASGACNVDVVCPEGDAWREEIPAVGVYTVNGTWTCTGAMVNNTSYDQTPYFLTANHCSVNSGNSSGVVIYWNFENSTCRPVGSGASGGSGDGSLSEFTTGSTWRASSSASDFTLIELNSAPDPAWEISFAGWDATGANATSAVAIHHPNTDEKRISFENDPTVTSSYLGTSSPGDGTHVRIVDWDLGTTEPGSSGSPLFNQDHHIIGQLHGGGAACG